MFEISTNPNNALWIEIHIQDPNLRMPYCDYEVVRHIHHLMNREREENDKLGLPTK